MRYNVHTVIYAIIHKGPNLSLKRNLFETKTEVRSMQILNYYKETSLKKK